jgi:ABC-type branched-subunit amino acid transport system substrate-binding protein
MKKGSWMLSILVLAAVIGGLMTPALAAEPKVLKVAVLCPLSGPAAALGDLWKKSLDIYSDMINERGVKVGQDTYKIQFIYADDQYSPQGAVAAANKVIFSDKVQFIASASPINAAISPLTNANKVIFVNRNANGFMNYDPKTMPYNVYSHCLAEVCAHYVYAAFRATPGVKTVGQLFAIGNKGTVDEAIARVKTFLEKNGAKALEPEWYPIGTQDFTPYLSKMNAANIDMLSVFGPPTDVLNMAKQRFAQGKKYPIVQTTTILNLKALVGAVGPEVLEGVVSEYDLPSALKMTKVSARHLADAQKFQEMWLAKYNTPLTEISTNSFGWAMLWVSLIVDAVQQAGTIDPDGVMKTFRGGTFETIIGKLAMTGTKKYGSPVFLGNPCMASVIKGGKEVYLGEVPMTDVDNLP